MLAGSFRSIRSGYLPPCSRLNELKDVRERRETEHDYEDDGRDL
jgi:hypothetical protein